MTRTPYSRAAAIGRGLVRVVPEGADLLGAEAVDVAPPGQHCVLGDARHAVLRIRHVDAVPVDGDAVLDVAVPQCHLDEIALPHTQLGPGHGVAEGERVHRAARRQPDSCVLGGEREALVRRARGAVELGDVDPARVGGVLRPPPNSCVPKSMTL